MTQKFCPKCGTQVNFSSQFCTSCGMGLANSLTGQLQAKTTLDGRYLIQKIVGQGGMGAVYKATDTRIQGKVCAIKEMSVLSLPLSERPSAMKLFAQEAKILADLSHPSLPKVFDYFEEGQSGRYYLVMDFVEGDSFENLLKQRGSPYPEEQVRQRAVQLCDVLSYLHKQNPPIIFRDLNPRNVMLNPATGDLKLIDFGIARFFKPGNSADTQAFGSPGYASPEQYGQAQTDGRSDIYSLGVFMLNLITAYDPSIDPFNLPSIRALSPSVTQELETIVYRATQTKPDLRYQTTGEMRRALLGDDGGKTAVPWKVIGGIGGTVTILFLIGAYLLMKREPAPVSPTPMPAGIVTVIVTEEVEVTAESAAGTKDTTPIATDAVSEVEKTSTPVLLTDTPVPTALPTITSVPTVQPTARTAVSVDLPTLNEAENMEDTVWKGIDFEDLQSPATKRYSTIIRSGEDRRWSFIWCGKTPADLQNILAPLTFSLLVDGQAISSEKLLEHDKVINNWHCRYWSTILYNWPSGEMVELEAHYELSERVYDGEGYYGAGTYRQIISVRVP